MTQVNLWGEDKRIYTVDVVVLGDARELTDDPPQRSSPRPR